MEIMPSFFFFFSSRRRHTRCYRDWSSDVCSSDLSIYGFRHADVQVFRERRAAAAHGVLPLTMNYRSRPEVLAVVNQLFGGDFGDEFQPLTASGEFPDPVFG